MEKERLPAFTDGVIAVIITIMILEMKVPQDASLGSLRSVIPVFLSYVLSFVYVAIYWNNHHHFFHLVRHVNGGMLWANINLLFWVSLVPFGRGRPASRTKPTRPSLTPASRTSSTAGGEQIAASSPTITSLSRGRANVAQRSFSLDPPRAAWFSPYRLRPTTASCDRLLAIDHRLVPATPRPSAAT